MARPYGVVLALLFLLPLGCGGPQQAVCGMGGTSRLPGNGARLAFACQLDSRGPYSSQAIFVASAGGGPAVRATYGLAQDVDPAWSPATGEIAFSSTRDGHLNVYAMRRDGAGVRRLTDAAAQEFEPDWSPDGSLVAFASGRGGARGPLGPKGLPASLYVMRPDGTGAVRLTDTSSYDGDPVWAPDGTRIAFVSDRAGSSDIWVMNSDGSAQARLTSGQDDRPSWSPDGTRLVFDRESPDGSATAIYVMNADGGGQRRLIAGNGTQPAWSPDGRWIAFVSDRDGHPNVYVASADGTDVLQVTRDSALKFRPAWSRP
jgi:Tol biopolymer transport system component